MKKHLKKIIPIVGVTFLLVVTLNSCEKKQNIQVSQTTKNVVPLLDDAGNPTKDLLALTAYLNVHHDGSLKSIVAETQKHWLRPSDKERWEIEDRYQQYAHEIVMLVRKLGCIDAVRPSQQQYDYVLLLGSTLSSVRLRLAYLIELWHKGIRFKKLFLLGGERPLDKKLESQDNLLKEPEKLPFKASWQFTGTVPTTEITMMKLVVDQTAFPQDMIDALEIVFVSSPMKKKADGSVTRPTTSDTILAWLELNPLPGKCLAISQQPYVGYQHSVVKTILPQCFDIETVGQKVNTDYTGNTTTILDTIARWLYQESEYLNKSSKRSECKQGNG